MIPIPASLLPASQLQHFRPQPDRRAETAKRRRLLREFADARSQNRIELHFRPRLSLHDGHLLGAETRLRWLPRRDTMMRSNALFRLAEQVGEAASLAGWALREACRMAMTWPDDRAMVSVRIPPELQRPSLLNLHLAEALELSGLAPERLELRLAEPDLAELGANELLGLCAVRDLGVGVALEHFGTGATSLALLRRLPLSTITLDAALSRHAPQDREDSAILRAILAATRALGLESVADGVQSEAQRQFLVSAGCDGAQGTLLGPDGPQSHLLRKMRLG